MKHSILIFVGLLIAMYFLMTYSYAGYVPDFPEETRFRHIYKGQGFVLETDSVADRAIESSLK